MQSLTRQQAREIIDSIREENGGISPEDREKTPASVLRSLENVRRKLGAATTTLATNLYSKDTRFVFELIQNADDNKYTRATAAGHEPFLTFSNFGNQIVVDSNEDGFSERDVRAICSVGESTKTISKGFIGEKGIGFKSVFKIATKVHIQSGPFSFYFEYQHGDGGLGMVTPIYQDHEDLPEGVHTRITLTLARVSSVLGGPTSEIFQIPDTLVIFLRKLKCLSIVTVAEDDRFTTLNKYSYQETGRRGTLTQVSRTLFGGSTETTQLYHVTRKLLTNLPTEPARRHTNQAEVVLAFPITEESEPIIAQQHVFAFLPLCRAGFSFLIQSDFLTQASREDILQSPWNESILDGVAMTFRDAVLQFCEHPSLQYQWLKYLPSESISGSFWAQLRSKVVSYLKTTKVIRPWSECCLKLPGSLKRLTLDACDRFGEPLFVDLTNELYLSSHYQWTTQADNLKELGVRFISFHDVLERLQADLGRSSSRYKAATTDEDWHTRVANMLNRYYELQSSRGVTRTMQRSWTMQLIPLRNGQWVSGSLGDMFYPDSDGIAVPTDLGLRLIDPEAVKNTSRKELFNNLGAKSCVPRTIVDLILRRYNIWNPVNLKTSISHLSYLYWWSELTGPSLNPLVCIMDQNQQPVYRRFATFGRELIVDDLYFGSDDEYGARNLLKPIKQDPERNVRGAPGFDVHFIHPDYLSAVSAQACRDGLSWQAWLENVAEVRRWPRLVKSSDPSHLSQLFLYIVDERPQKLVGTLKAHWSHYANLMNFEIVDQLANASVPCECGNNDRLEQTYLPLPSLVRRCRELGVDEFWSFLKLPTELTTDTLQDWVFLKTIGVKTEENLEFYLDALDKAMIWNYAEWKEDREESLFTIYEAIQDQAKAADEALVKQFFTENPAVFAGVSESGTVLWKKPVDCVWNAPPFLLVVTPLASMERYRGNKRLANLFHEIVGIPNAGWRDFLNELNYRKANGIYDENITKVYSELSRKLRAESDRILVREKFQNAALIYLHEESKWLSASSCIWADATRIAGKVAIAAEYGGLEDFFVGIVGVETPNLDTFVQELKTLAQDINDELPTLNHIENIKYLITEISSREPTATTLATLNMSNILPAKGLDGSIRLRTTVDDFMIIDRVEYGDLFSGKLTVLSFSLEEVHSLRPFLMALGLGNRYTSGKVEERTIVNGGYEEPTLTSVFRQKAYAFYRCAVHFNNPGSQNCDHSLYRRLQEAVILESNGIKKTLRLSQAGHVITAESSRGHIHIDERDRLLKIYVPRDPRSQELCYLSQLPQKLLGFLSISDIAAREILTKLLNSSLYIVDDLLNDNGIVRVDGVEPLRSESRPEAESEYSIVEANTVESNFASDVPLLVPARSPSNPIQSPRPTRLSTPHSGVATSTGFSGYPITPGSPRSPSSSTEREDLVAQRALNTRNEYRGLLDRVIEAAKDAVIPAQGPFDLTALSETLISDSGPDPSLIEISRLGFGVRSENQMSHDMKIGAAGELFVFELLLGLGLPGFSRDNWRSTIRKEVRVHEKYSNMAPWNGSETADIVYDDTEGDLSFYLTGQGYLPRNPWFNARPRYYIEVKTTTRGCKTPFFMSKSQYERMQNLSLSSTPNTNPEIYVIIRVFNLGQDQMGVRIYLDPEKMRRNEELIFTAQSYSVAPTNQAGGHP